MASTPTPYSVASQRSNLTRTGQLCILLMALLWLLPAPGNADTTVSGTISTDTTWTLAGSPYIVTSNIFIQGTDGADNITTLTIEPGVQVRFNRYRYLNIGANSGNPGALIAQGTAAEPIVFTANQTTPAPGDWYGLRIYNTADDTTTRMQHCIVEYSGYASNGAIYIYSAAPTLQNCEFRHNSFHDLNFAGTVGGTIENCTIHNGIYLQTTSSVYFNGNTFHYNNTYPIKTYADNVHALVNGNTFTNLDPASHIYVNSGNISKDATWTSAIPIFLNSNLIVQGTDGSDSITTLTLAPGATLKFNLNRYLNIGANTGNPGALITQGTSAEPVVFTSNQTTPAPGDWYGIRFYNTTHDTTTLLQHCNIQYAGFGNMGSAYIHNSTPTLRHCTFSHSSNYDLYYAGTVGGTIENCTLNSGIHLQTTSDVNFNANTFNYNNTYPINTYADNVHALVNGNTFANLDATSHLYINNSNLTKDATWSAAIPILLNANLIVQGTDGDDNLTTLTLLPGVKLNFNQNRFINIGANTGNPGALITQGTSAEPVVFTSNQATPAPGDWYGIRFYNTTHDTTTLLQHCNIQYAGFGNMGSAYIHNSAPTLRHCTFSHSSNYDLYYAGIVGGTIENCTLNSGIYLQTTSSVNFNGNNFHYNNAYPIKTYANNVHALVNGNTFTNLDAASHLYINNSNLTKDATWSAAIPIVINNNLIVQGTDGSDSITTLTLLPGTTLKFNPNRYLNIGANAGNPGALIAQGTADKMIIFTANAATPAPGNWCGIRFYNTADDTSSILQHSVIQYAGYANQGALQLSNAKPAVRNTTIHHNQDKGLYIYGTGCNDADIQCNTFTHNGYGIYTAGNALPAIQFNNFTNQSVHGLYNASSVTVSAQNNWWGDANGPNQSGDSTYGNLNTDPWSVQENQCTGSATNHPPHTPTAPTPADAAVRINITNGLHLNWSGGDPDPLDTVTYTLYRGTAATTLTLHTPDLPGTEYQMQDLTAGATYFWQIIAKDSQGLETNGPVWRFTTNGDPPDLIVSGLTTDPAGHLQPGQTITFTADIHNQGNGPVVDPFSVDFLVNSTSIGTVNVNTIVLAAEIIPVSHTWTYPGGDPTIEVKVDSQSQVSETLENNNLYSATLSAVADNTAPAITNHAPANNAHLSQIQQITLTLTDSQSTVDDTAVIASFTLKNSNQQTIPGTVTEANDTFTFVPNSLSLADDTYQVSATAADIHGNTQPYTFTFTIDTQPPAKPIITGGIVTSGLIQPRPAQNTTGQFVIVLKGQREASTSVWINGVQQVENGNSDWSVQVTLQPGDNSFEVWLKDLAGNQGASEWVDISMLTGSGVSYEYNDSGRIKQIQSNP